MTDHLTRGFAVLLLALVSPVIGPAVTAAARTTSSSSTGSDFFPLAPQRLYDAVVGDGQSVDVVVTGVAGVPKTGVSAVAMNVTVVGTSRAGGGHVALWPTGSPSPASTVNFALRATAANLAVLRPGTGNQVTVHAASSARVILDVTGYFGTGNGGLTYHAVSPSRVMDTRNGLGGYHHPIGPHSAVEVVLQGSGGLPTSGIAAVAGTLTALNATGPTHLRVWATGSAMPSTSNLSIVGQSVVSNLVLSGVGPSARWSIYNESGAVDVVLDLSGWFATTAGGTRFRALTPARLADSRTGLGVAKARLAPGQIVNLQVTGVGGVPKSGATAVALNLVAVRPTALTYFTVWPAGQAHSVSAALAALPGRDTAGLVIAKVGSNGMVTIRNAHGRTDLVVDVEGWFGPATTSSSS